MGKQIKILLERDVMETNVKKKLMKSSIALGDRAS